MLNPRNALMAASLLGLGVLFFLGCSRQPATQQPADRSASNDDGKLPAGLAQLSEAERAAAVKQKVCPVSTEELGSMGKPPKVTVDGQEVFLCCAGCEDELRKDPEKYLANLKSE